MMKNDDARAYFVEKGLTYSIITEAFIEQLEIFITEELNAYRLTENGKSMDMRLRKTLKKQVKILKRTGLIFAYLRVDGSYFHNREAISFNKDGFIGFGGEFSSNNTQPYLKAFVRWCDFVASEI
ncbi:hypothetical protein ACOMCU_01525 [Lysinibacillus sp. UGB7]|uniref:hypothetical protein n=1 Tax=Lysinibacillus sp. UGB7 TaxID=3411039 RepID=UPI003B7AFC13